MNKKHKLTAKLYTFEVRHGKEIRLDLLEEREETFLSVYNAYRREHDYVGTMNFDLDEARKNCKWFVEIEKLAA